MLITRASGPNAKSRSAANPSGISKNTNGK